MTQDEIIRMAKEAGFQHDMFGIGIWDSMEFNRFAALVAAVEREACAKVCESDEMRYECSDECAAAVRSMGEQK